MPLYLPHPYRTGLILFPSDSNLNFTAFTVVAKAAAYVLAEFANSTAAVEAARAPGAANLRKAPVRSSNDALVASGKSCSHEQILQ